jgi:formylglycine-generating enzyme required for sulfatase activity
MSRIFLSHASRNNAEAIALRDWLVSHGWDDLFLDLDAARGLRAGDRWQAALKQAAERCELVIFLVSPEWAASKWCLAEFLLAKNLNKRIFGVTVEPTPLADLPVEMTAEWQLVDLTAGKRDHKTAVTPPPGHETFTVAFAKIGLDRLRIGLMQAGLDPRYFVWPPESDLERAPYRGLQPLDAEDAGIFFGRDGPIVVGLDLLRGLREAPPPRLLVILGASGAGKSSFLRAGLLPRIARESQHFISLPEIRPERAALTNESGLIASLENALKEAGRPRPRAEIRKGVESGAASVASFLQDLVNAKIAPHTGDGTKAPRPPTLILPIDQAEELFQAEGAEEARAFLDLLRGLVSDDAPALIAIFTIRSDSYERLQTVESLQDLRQHALSLPPMPRGAYAEVIKGPARRLEGTKRALKIEESLVDALLADIEEGGAKDALPLLAFTLERLYREHGGGGDLKLSDYEEMGRIRGSIEAAVERALKAADAHPNIPRDREARLALLRRGLIPWLAGIDPDTGSPRRRIALCSEIPSDSRPLIDLLVEQRLLSTDVKDTGEITIEPVHEALLRQWGLLQGWLAEDAGLLSVLEGVKRASRDWATNDKGAPWLTHGGERLKTAEQLAERPDLAANLVPTDRDYLAACRNTEQAATVRKRRVQAAFGLLAFGILAGAFGWLNQDYLQEQWRWFSTIRPYMLTEFRPYVLPAEAEQALKPKDTFRECAKNCPEMVAVPAGEFLMGSPHDEKDRRNDEGPMRKVVFANPLAISEFEVTFDDWDACAAYGDCPNVDDSGWGRGRQPVINVSWDDAQGYVAWLSRMTGKTYRLLSEAEWEYAARGGTQTAYFWGDEIGRNNADCDGCDSRWGGRQTAPVGSFAPNAFGLYDMHGNVLEWVEDCVHGNYWDGSYSGAPEDGSAWTAGGDCDRRIVRGGSWDGIPQQLRSAFRGRSTAGLRNSSVGFRVARTLTP